MGKTVKIPKPKIYKEASMNKNIPGVCFPVLREVF